MEYEDRQKIYKEIIEQKAAHAHTNKLVHIPRYWIIVIWGLFMSFVVYTYALNSLNDLDEINSSIENIKVVQKPQKVKATIEFLPNEPEPRFVQMPSF